jgi:hypothetical protein
LKELSRISVFGVTDFGVYITPSWRELVKSSGLKKIFCFAIINSQEVAKVGPMCSSLRFSLWLVLT